MLGPTLKISLFVVFLAELVGSKKFISSSICSYDNSYAIDEVLLPPLTTCSLFNAFAPIITFLGPMQTVKTQTRMQHLIRVYTVCLQEFLLEIISLHQKPLK